MLQSSKLGLLNKLYKIHHAEFWHLTRHWGNPRCCSFQVGQGSAQFSQHLAAPYLYRDDGLILTLFKDVKTCVRFRDRHFNDTDHQLSYGCKLSPRQTLR